MNTTLERQTIHGPGIKISLDASEIIPDDPGAGTPAIVISGKFSGTYWCALDTGELDCGEYHLTERQINWLDEQHDAVSAWHRHHLGQA
jgi:hypothetical protein